jgi:hypothetical protein
VDRAYINIHADVLPWLRGRITPDISLDEEGDGIGDREMILKYCYVTANLPDAALFTQPTVEFGVLGRPWIEFEQKVNLYRVRGKMFLERGAIVNSADFGVALQALFGAPLPEEYQKTVSSAYPGRYGSMAIGVYNGGGYNAIEQNINKTIEGRLTLRPLPDMLPGLQLTYAGVHGKGNVVQPVDWTKHVGYLSFEHRRLTATATYFSGMGGYEGLLTRSTGSAENIRGWSVFSDIRIPATPLSIYGRYDHFRWPDRQGSVEENTIITGIVWHIQRKTKLLIDYEAIYDSSGDCLGNTAKISTEFGF